MRCNATVYRRDTYRVSSRVKGRMKLHYQRGQCTRPAVTDGNGYCWQHCNPNVYTVRYS